MEHVPALFVSKERNTVENCEETRQPCELRRNVEDSEHFMFIVNQSFTDTCTVINTVLQESYRFGDKRGENSKANYF
jgi:hypothetical protein